MAVEMGEELNRDPSHPWSFSKLSKLLKLHGETKSSTALLYVVLLKVCLIIFDNFTVISFVLTFSE